MFDKEANSFPIKDSHIFLSHCGVSPLYSRAFEEEVKLAREHMLTGSLVTSRYEEIMSNLRGSAARMMRTAPENLSFVKNTSEAMSIIANGYPFDVGDEIVSYIHEYPANHYPWRLQEKRGVKLVLLPDKDPSGSAPKGSPAGWSMDDLRSAISNRTRVVAVSHVQFASGFCADLDELGAFCAERGIDLIVDAAQSLGALPLYPESMKVAAVAASGWKWLMGPIGTGLLYTSESFRSKMSHVMVGAGLMRQGTDYLDHTWNPHSTGERFEYSTSPLSLAVALTRCIQDMPLRYGLEDTRSEIFRLQDLLLTLMDRGRFKPLQFQGPHRSGIISIVCGGGSEDAAQKLMRRNVICSSRAGYLRFAPHFCTTDDEIHRFVEILHSI